MPAWDNVQLQGPPQAPSYQAPQIGMQLGALLGNLPQDYLQGIQQQQQIRQLGLINQILGQQTGGGQPTGNVYGDQGAGPTAAAGPGAGGQTASADPRGMLPTILDAAQQNNINPRYLARLTRGEGLADYNGDYENGKPTSFGAMQLHFGGKTKGLGDEYYAETGKDPRDQANEKDMIYWGARKAAQGGWGPWTAARKMGWGKFEGIGGQQTASTDPNFVPQQGAQPPQASAESPQQPGAPTTQVAQAAPQQAPQGGASAASALVPQQWRTDPRGYADALGNRANQLRKEADRIESGAKIQAGPIKIEPKAEGLRKAADDADATRSRVLDALKQEAEPTTGQKEASDPAILRSKGQQEVQPGDIKRGQATFNGITAAARQYETDLKPYLDLTRSIVNDPRAYTGIGAERRLDWNRVTAQWGNGNAAMLKEMLNKVRAQTVLNTINTQKDEMSEASGGPGSSSSRLFSQQVQQIEKAVPGLETTLGGNRALVEIATRVGEHQSQMAQMARDYIAEQKRRGGPGYLDPGFDQKISDHMKARPLFTEQERAHPELLGAPTMPPTVKSAQDLSNWGKSLGLNSGDAFRTASGQIRALP